MSSRGLVAAIIAAVGLSGCGVIRDAKDMKNTMKDLKTTGEHIAKRTDDLEREMKYKESSAMFTYFMDLLFGENGKGVQSQESNSANPETELLMYAEGGIRALTFQFWKGDFNEGPVPSLDKDFDLSAVMFFVRVSKFIPKDMALDSWIPDRSFKALASVAARLEQVQDSYAAALKNQGLPNLSFYEVILQALRDRDAVSQGDMLPKAKTKILEWKKEAIYLLQLRHNYLPMMVLSRITDFQDRGNISRAWMAFRGSKIKLNDPDPAMSISNALLVETTGWLNEALETRERLKAIGIEPQYNRMFGRLLGGLDFGQDAILARQYPASGNAERDKLIYDFAVAYKKVVSDMPSNLKVLPDNWFKSAPVKDVAPSAAPAAATSPEAPMSTIL